MDNNLPPDTKQQECSLRDLGAVDPKLQRQILTTTLNIYLGLERVAIDNARLYETVSDSEKVFAIAVRTALMIQNPVLEWELPESDFFNAVRTYLTSLVHKECFLAESDKRITLLCESQEKIISVVRMVKKEADMRSLIKRHGITDFARIEWNPQKPKKLEEICRLTLHLSS